MILELPQPDFDRDPGVQELVAIRLADRSLLDREPPFAGIRYAMGGESAVPGEIIHPLW